MDIYTLNSDFTRKNVIDEYHTALWTERYSASGDFVLVVPGTKAMMAKLQEGTFVSTPESDEVGIVESVDLKEGKLEVTGFFLTAFLRNRAVRNSADHRERYWNFTGKTPGQVVGDVVTAACISGGTPHVPGGASEVIPNLTLGTVSSGTAADRVVDYGNVYDVVKKVCEEDQLGFRLYLHSVSPSAYELKFQTYRGRDLTRAQSINLVVIFEPALDSLMNTKELRSIAAYKNVCYAYTNFDVVAEFGSNTVGIAYSDGGAAKTGFDRRSMQIFVDDVDTTTLANLAALTRILNTAAANALVNNNYVRMLDGELVPQLAFQYGTDYTLGDIIELRGESGLSQTARITEYIRSKDATGAKAYPTLSVITEE